MKRAHVVAILAASVMLTACGSLGGLASLLPADGSFRPSSAPVSTPAAQLTPPPQVITCEILPVEDVDGLSPFETAMVNFEDTGGCHYYPDVETEQRPASVDAVVEVFYDSAEAAAALAFERQELSNPELELTLADVSGVGDDALSRVDRIGDESGVWAISGQYMIKVTMRGEYQDGQGPDVSSQAKLDSAAEMVDLVITRLP